MSKENEKSSATSPIMPDDSEGDGCWLSQHVRFVCQSREKEPDVLLIGDSILYNFQFTQNYKSYIVPLHCLNFSIQDDQTQNILWRVQNGELDEIQVKVIVLSVGTHNSHPAQEIFDGIVAILKVIKEKQPDSHIVLMGLLPCGRAVNARRKKHEEVNKLLARTFNTPGSGVVFLCPDWEQFVRADSGNISHLDMLDYRIPTEEGYAKIYEPLVEELQTSLQTFLKTNAPSTSPL